LSDAVIESAVTSGRIRYSWFFGAHAPIGVDLEHIPELGYTFVRAHWGQGYPLPDPRHGDNPFNLAFDAIPIVFAGPAWAAGALRDLRPYQSVNLAAYVAVKRVILGFTLIDSASCSGLLQRVAAATIFVPIGVISWRLHRSADKPES
jgi:hypothetical protein